MTSKAQRKRNRRAHNINERRRGTPAVLVEAMDLTESITEADVRDALSGPLDEWAGPVGNGRYVWIRTPGEDDDGQKFVIVEVSGDNEAGGVAPGNYRVDFTLDTDTMAVTLGDSSPVRPKTEYIPVVATDVAEAELLGDTITLTESTAAIDDDGTISLKIIQPGWGSSGYYPAEVLESDGPTAFPAGTHMYWDHPTDSDELERPERSLRDLAAVTVTEANWDPTGPEGPGLYADAQVFTPYATLIEEMAPHIGVSIRAAGYTEAGEAEGRSGPIVESIGPGRSVDFVTTAGAGGQVLALFESARTTPTDPPAPRPTPTPDPLKETDMPTPADLTEARRQITTLEEAVAERDNIGAALLYENAELRNTNARLTEARNVGVAQGYAAAALTESVLSDAARKRIADTVCANPPLTEAGDVDKDKLTEAITTAETAELDYLQENGVHLGRPRSMGDGPAAGGADEKTLEERESFFSDVFGLTEAGAKHAAKF